MFQVANHCMQVIAREIHVLMLNKLLTTELLTQKPSTVPFPTHIPFQLSSEYARLL